MERETKVGLLAGLAVIICFSVILANRGRRDVFDAAPGPFFVDFSNRQGAVPDDGTRPSLPAHAALPARPSEPAVVRANTPAEAPGNAGLSTRLGDVPPGGSIRADDAFMTFGAFAARPPTVGGTNAAIENLPESLAVNLSARRPDASAATIPVATKDAAGNPPPSPPSPAEATRTGRRYTVSPGDTLSKIAAAHYGTRSGTAVRAIFEHNRGAVESPDALKAGMEILLPLLPPAPSQPTTVALVKSEVSAKPSAPVEAPASKRETPADKARKVPADAAKTAAAPPTGRVAQSEKPKSAPSTSPRWYEVKKGEGLQRIAREQLGDSSRWKEIHDLNRAALAAPEKLREGTRIRLPDRDPGDGSRGRRRS